jgi:hypothetical protein
MNGQLSEDLRSGMEQVAQNVVMPSGLARRAYLRWRKRRVRTSASAVAAAMAVVAGAAFALTNVGDGTGPQVQDLGGTQVRDLGYVATHVDNALAAVGRRNNIFVVRTTATALGSNAAAPGFPWATDLAWNTRDRFNELEYTSAGRLFFSLTVTRVPGGLRMLTVQYLHQAVIRQELTGSETALGCSNAVGVLGTLDLNPDDLTNWPATIHVLVGCKLLTVAGHQRVGRADLIRFVQPDAYPRFLHLVVLVNPSTYLPSRMVITWSQPGQAWQTTTEFWSLTPTRANLAHLSAPTPPKFQRVYVPRASASSSGYEAQTFWMFGQ